MIRNFMLKIEYDGSAYHGWQRQKGARTIQAEIERALSTMTRQPVTLFGAGRTDAGVHARGQVANFKCQTALTADIFQKGLNSLLPEDVVIRQCLEVAADFHARYGAKSKRYAYRIINQPIRIAIGRQYAWYVLKPLDLAAMQAVVPHLVGTQDFRSFEGVGSPRKHSRRHVIQAQLLQTEQNTLVFEIEADGFLRYMVRNIVGTLVAVGLGRLSPEDFPRILAARDRGQAAATAPAHGLFLMEVKYE
jgi:tRNA pseudouridine38-40 synthase